MDNTGIASIYLPKTLNDLLVCKAEHPDIIIMAGGTYLLSQPGYYPCKNNREILSTDEVPDLTKITHSERFIEVGASTTIDQLLNAGSYLLSHSTFSAIENISSYPIRTKATVGGALCIPTFRFSLCNILATIQAQAELKIITKYSSHNKKCSTGQIWLPIGKLYNSKGEFQYAKANAIMTRIRIPARDNAIQIFMQAGSPVREPQHSVFLGLEYLLSQNSISQTNLCLSFGENGFFLSREFNLLLSSFSLPFSAKNTEEIFSSLSSMLEERCPDLTQIQKERAFALIRQIIYKLNRDFLSYL